jgi:MoxR-like ATPase
VALPHTKSSKALPPSQARTYATPDDVKALAVPVLSHRLILHPEAEFDGVTPEAVVGQVLLDVPPPTQREAV